MAAPNLLSITTITGKTVYVSLSTAGESAIVNNAASSGKVLKVNTLFAANTDITSASAVTVNVHSADDIGGTSYAIASKLSVPSSGAVVIIDKNSTLYLEEDQSIGAQAVVGGDIVIVASYEDIS